MGMASHFKTIAYTDTSPVFSRSLRRRDAWTNGDMHAIRRLPHQLFEGVGACTFLHSNRLSSCCRRGKYPHSTEPVPQCEDDVVMVTGQQPGALERQPTLGLEVRALGAGAMPTRIVPDPHHMAVRACLDMATERGGATLHNGVRGFADVSGQGMGVFIGGKDVLEDHLQRDERHRGLCTSGLRASSGCFAQYHANYPRCKRLVQLFRSYTDPVMRRETSIVEPGVPAPFPGAGHTSVQNFSCTKPLTAFG